MLLKVRSIPTDGMDVRFQVATAALRSGLPKKDELSEIITDSANCSFHISPMKKDVFLRGGIRTSLNPVCARCGEIFQYPVSLDLELTLSPQPAKDRRKSADSYQESDEGIVYFRNDEINLDEVVREQILLSLPIKYLCHPDCKGLCAACQANLNQGPHTCKVRPLRSEQE